MRKILVIEDNESVLSGIVQILKLANYDVITASNGKSGVEKAIEFLPDLVLCDIVMPELDGFGVLHALRKHPKLKAVPFIFLTAKAERTDFRKGMSSGADDYLIKPIDGTELLGAIAARLEKADNADPKPYNQRSDSPGNQNPVPLEQWLHEYAENGDTRIYRRKQLVYNKGQHARCLFYVQEGKIKTYVANDEGRELVTDVFCKGDFLGHVALIEETVYKDTAEVLEDCRVTAIPKEAFDQLLNTRTDLARNFTQVLAHSITDRERKLIGMAYNPLRKKVASALMFLKGKYNGQSNEPVSIDITRNSLASLAGTATESLIRTMSDFKKEGILTTNESTITIINARKLERLLNQ